MIIDKSNIELLNTKEIYIHDDILVSFHFDRNSKVLTLKFNKHNDRSKEYTIVFSNVVGFAMTACDFWGASECVLDFEYIALNDQIIVPKLQTKWLDNPHPLHDALCDNCIETLITFSSGDELRIACEKIEIQDL